MNNDAIKKQIAENLQQIQQQISVACKQSGRSTDDVRLVAVTKYAQLEWVQALVSMGVTDLGESRPQQLIERATLFDNSVNWHLIGHLQRNKVRSLLSSVSLIHSVDSMRLIERINLQAQELSLRPKVLLEVNISGEAVKDGFAPSLLKAEWDKIINHNHVEITGLMTMAPLVSDPENARPCFQQLHILCNELQEQSEEKVTLRELSMGMSRDFTVAIEEGATIIRVGSRLFEGLA